MVLVVNCQPLTTEAQVESEASPRGICCEQCGTGTGFSPKTSVSPVSIPPMLQDHSPPTNTMQFYQLTPLLDNSHKKLILLH
jgi:hypothetical protein